MITLATPETALTRTTPPRAVTVTQAAVVSASVAGDVPEGWVAHGFGGCEPRIAMGVAYADADGKVVEVREYVMGPEAAVAFRAAHAAYIAALRGVMEAALVEQGLVAGTVTA